MSDNETTQEAPKQTDQSISEIDKALQSANARRAKKASTGVVFKAQRIRCYVTLEGVSKPVYLFTSDVSPVAAESSEAASA